jgi:hypothetical protein
VRKCPTTIPLWNLALDSGSTIGKFDICLEVLMMSNHLALPRERHLEALFHNFAY